MTAETLMSDYPTSNFTQGGGVKAVNLLADYNTENGTTLTGIWFRPLPDELAHKISKKYQLYKG